MMLIDLLQLDGASEPSIEAFNVGVACYRAIVGLIVFSNHVCLSMIVFIK